MMLILWTVNYIDLTWNELLRDSDSTDYNVVQDMIASGPTVNYLPRTIPTVLGQPAGLRLSAVGSIQFTDSNAAGCRRRYYSASVPP